MRWPKNINSSKPILRVQISRKDASLRGYFMMKAASEIPETVEALESLKPIEVKGTIN